MYCSKCGKLINDDSQFCRYCGETILSENEIASHRMYQTKGEFITLNCPSCGGKLEIQPNTESLVCKYCGAEHLVKKSIDGVRLERYARCPTCGRNDRSVKGTLRFGNLVKPVDTPLLQPINSMGKRIFSVVLILILLIMTIVLFEPSIWKNIIVGINLLSILIFSVRNYKDVKKVKNTNPKIIEENKLAREKYENGIQVWDDIYFCERDGTYFSIKDKKVYSSGDFFCDGLIM